MQKSWQQNIAVTVDVILLARLQGDPALLLVQRGREPFLGKWALPGGFVENQEDLEAAAHRELAEETGIAGLTLTQWQTFGTPGRDPRGRTISVVFLAFHEGPPLHPKGGDDAAKAQFHLLKTLPPLAFDHQEIVTAFQKLPRTTSFFK